MRAWVLGGWGVPVCQCVQLMSVDVGGRGCFVSADSSWLLLLLRACRSMHHPNRFVRETAHFTAATLCQALQGEGEGRLLAVGQDLAERLADGLSDNWSQVRPCVVGSYSGQAASAECVAVCGVGGLQSLHADVCLCVASLCVCMLDCFQSCTWGV